MASPPSAPSAAGAPPATLYLFTALRSVGTVAVLATSGAYMRHKGVMTPEFTKGLSFLALKLTLPVLLFTSALNCQQNRSELPCGDLAQNIAHGWPLLLLPLWNVGAGLLIGRLAAWLGGAKAENRHATIAAVTFGNSTGLPITLLTTVQLQMPPTSDLGSTSAILFLGVYLVAYPLLQWSVGLRLLRPAETSATPPVTGVDSGGVILLQQAERRSGIESGAGADASGRADETSAAVAPRSQRSTQLEEALNPSDDGAPHRRGEPGCSAAVVRLGALAWRNRYAILPPPAVGSLCGAICALIPPLRLALVDYGDRDDDAPLEWIFDGLLKLGGAAVPVNMLLLGSTLSKAVRQRDALRQAITARLALCIALAKLVVMPSFGLMTAVAINALGLVPGASRVFYLVVMVVTCTPTANSIVLMAELAGCNREAVSAAILLQYLLAPLTLTFWLFVFMQVVLSM